jgi:hypothetical protein
MPTPEVSFQLVAEHSDDTNAQPSCVLDTNSAPSGPLQLDGFKLHSMGTIIVAPADVDKPLLFTGAVALVLLSDEKFSLRLAAGESLLADIRSFFFMGDDADTPAHATGVCLTGNGANEAAVTYWIYEAV